MMNEAIPASVRDLLDRHLSSIDHVELLLLFARDETRTWSAADAATSVHGQVDLVGKRLHELVEASLLAFESESSTYRYAPRRALRESVAQLSVLYDQRPVTLIRAIYDRRPPRPRSFTDILGDAASSDEARRRSADADTGADG